MRLQPWRRLTDVSPGGWLTVRPLTHADDRVQQNRILRVQRHRRCCPKTRQEALSVSAGTDRPMVYKDGWAAGLAKERTIPAELRLQNLFSHCGGADWNTLRAR